MTWSRICVAFDSRRENRGHRLAWVGIVLLLIELKYWFHVACSKQATTRVSSSLVN